MELQWDVWDGETSKSVQSLVEGLSEIWFLPLECSFMYALCIPYTYSSHKESTWPVGFLGSPTYVEAMSLGGKLVKMFDGSTNYTRIIIAHDTGLIHA